MNNISDIAFLLPFKISDLIFDQGKKIKEGPLVTPKHGESVTFLLPGGCL